MKTTALIEKGKDGTYSIFTPNIDHVIIGSGDTVEKAKKDFENSVKEILAFYTEEDKKIPTELKNITFEYQYDMASFFNYFDWINVSKFAKKAYINASLMRQYKLGQYISETQVKKIEHALNKLGREISEIKLTV